SSDAQLVLSHREGLLQVLQVGLPAVRAAIDEWHTLLDKVIVIPVEPEEVTGKMNLTLTENETWKWRMIVQMRPRVNARGGITHQAHTPNNVPLPRLEEQGERGRSSNIQREERTVVTSQYLSSRPALEAFPDSKSHRTGFVLFLHPDHLLSIPCASAEQYSSPLIHGHATKHTLFLSQKERSTQALVEILTPNVHEPLQKTLLNATVGSSWIRESCLNFRACPAAESKFESRGVHAYQDFLHGDIKPQGKGILQASYWFGLRLPIWFKLT
ncbi:hypothetical protein DNTS_007639, partial [Danionella cerebrum]